MRGAVKTPVVPAIQCNYFQPEGVTAGTRYRGYCTPFITPVHYSTRNHSDLAYASLKGLFFLIVGYPYCFNSCISRVIVLISWKYLILCTLSGVDILDLCEGACKMMSLNILN